MIQKYLNICKSYIDFKNDNHLSSYEFNKLILKTKQELFLGGNYVF